MPFSGPFDLSLSGVQTVFPGPGGTGTSRVTSSPAPVQSLTLGPSTAAFNPGAGFFEGPVAGGPESITGVLAGAGTPSLGPSGPDPDAGAGQGRPAFGLGFNAEGPQSAVQTGLQAGLNAATLGFAGRGTPGSQIAGLVGNVAGSALGVPLAGPVAAGLFAGFNQALNNSAINADPIGFEQGLTNRAVADLGMTPTGLTPAQLGIPPNVDPTTAVDPFGGLGLPSPEPTVGVDPFGGIGTPDASPPSGVGDSQGDVGGAAGDGGAGAGAGPTVICTVLYRHGYLDERTWLADRLFGSLVDPAVYSGYLRWATPVAAVMERSPAIRWLVSLVACRWARAMAGEQNWLGDLVMTLGVPLCRWLGRKWALV